jgi:hypothetical protein
VSVNISNLSKIKRNESFSFKGEEGYSFQLLRNSFSPGSGPENTKERNQAGLL